MSQIPQSSPALEVEETSFERKSRFLAALMKMRQKLESMGESAEGRIKSAQSSAECVELANVLHLDAEKISVELDKISRLAEEI